MKRAATLATLAASFLATTPGLAAMLAPPTSAEFSTAVRVDSVVEVVAGDSKPRRQESTRPLRQGIFEENDATVEGVEARPCGDYGRTSIAASKTVSRAVTRDDRSLDVSVGLHTFAQGGHVRLCKACVKGQCLGSTGIDTNARSSARVAVSTDIDFASSAGNRGYRMVVEHDLDANSVERTVALLRPDGGEQPIVSGQPIAIDLAAGRHYRVVATLKGESADKGGCCEDEKHGNLQLHIVIAPAPGIANSVFLTDQRIRSSRSTAPEVGLLLTRGDAGEPVPVCAATVVGPRTVLTAAHCLEFYSKRPELYFVSGDRLTQGLVGANRIDSWARPSEGPFQYRSEKGRTVDDIALLFTADELGIKPIALFGPERGEPEAPGRVPAEAVLFISTKERETKFEGEDAQRASVPVYFEPIDPRAARIVSQSGKLCAGWDGAPVIVSIDDAPVVIAMTVSANSDCLGASALRLDAYRAWLAARIQ